jgi:hypothetical protein
MLIWLIRDPPAHASNVLAVEGIDVLSLLPRDTSHVRNILFTLPLPFSLSRANHEQFWPLIDNAYSIRRSRDVGFRKRDTRLHVA